MLLLEYLESIIYIVAFTMIFVAAYLIYSLQYIQSKKLIYRLRIQSKFNKVHNTLENHLYNKKADKLFKDAGGPLKLNSFRYNLIRICVFLGSFILINIDWVSSGGSYPVNVIGILFIFYLLTSLDSRLTVMPIQFILEKLKSLHNMDKVRECFLLYSMLLNEFFIDDDNPHNMYSILKKLTTYFRAIKPALLKCLALWKNNPDLALKTFAEEVGIEEARDLADILKNVDSTDPIKARDILQSRYEQFQVSRIENHRRSLKNRDLLGYIITWIPIIGVSINMVIVISLVVSNLSRFVYSH